MIGTKFFSLKSARAKARTVASILVPSDAVPKPVALALAAATGGDVTRLGGGLPIVHKGHVVGGIGVGSGTPDQDKEIAQATLEVLSI